MPALAADCITRRRLDTPRLGHKFLENTLFEICEGLII